MNARRRTPFVLMFMVFATLLFLNVDGYPKHIWSHWPDIQTGSQWMSGDFNGEPPAIDWQHGWPCCFKIRSSTVIHQATFEGAKPHLVFQTRWLTDWDDSYFHPVSLVVDVIVMAFYMTGVYFTFRDWALLRFRFGLKSIFFLMTSCAVFFAFQPWEKIPRHIPQFAALGFIAIITLGIVGRVTWAVRRYLKNSRQEFVLVDENSTRSSEN